MEQDNNVLRFRVTPELMTRLEAVAAQLNVKPPELARIALAAGLRAMFGEEIGEQPRQAA